MGSQWPCPLFLLFFCLVLSLIGAIVAGIGLHNIDRNPFPTHKHGTFDVVLGVVVAVVSLVGSRNSKSAVYALALYGMWMFEVADVTRALDVLRQIFDDGDYATAEAGLLLMIAANSIALFAFPYVF